MAGTDHTKPVMGGGPAIILVRPQLAENIGMAARAMANFGLSDMRLVAPRDGWPQKTAMKKGAHQAASGASYILEDAKLFANVEEATADLNKVFATTARERGQAKPVHGADEAARDAKERIEAGQKIGILFGPERTGLENDEIALADAIITFPVNPAFASLNLAQAVLLVGYDWFRIAGELPEKTPLEKRVGRGAHRSPPATREGVFSFFDFLEGELDKVGFFTPAEKRPIMVRNLRNIFHRLEMTEQDVRTLRGLLVALIHGRRRPTSTGD